MPLRHFKHDLEQNEDYHLHIFSLQSALVVKVEWEWYCFTLHIFPLRLYAWNLEN